MMTALKNLMMPCREATRLASEALDRRLLFGERLALRFHLLMCNLCQRYAQQLRLLHGSLHKHPVDVGTLELSSEARERIKVALRGAS